MPEQDIFREAAGGLLLWYNENARDLPWRRTKDPYRIWVSEIMLQQTRVETVIPYYERFLSQLKDVDALARAEDDLLLKLWEGLGYYSRVRNMRRAARCIVEEGRFPDTCEELLKLPGIGPYTAAAVSSIAFGRAVPAVDGNVCRVAARLFAYGKDIRSAAAQKEIRSILESFIPGDEPGRFNQAMMEIGAMVCIPRGEPRCTACPLCAYCRAYKEGSTGLFPVRSKGPARRVEDKTVLAVTDGVNILLDRRPQSGLLAGLYELPSLEGKAGDKRIKAYFESLGLKTREIRHLPDAVHIFSHIEWHMRGRWVLTEDLTPLSGQEPFLVAPAEEAFGRAAVPGAFGAYIPYLNPDKKLLDRAPQAPEKP